MKINNLRQYGGAILAGLALAVVVNGGIRIARWQWEARATDRTLTTRADFEQGYFNNIDSKSKEGEMTLNASGTWGARVFKTPKVTVSNQTAIVSDGTSIYMLAYMDRYFARYIPNEDRWETLAKSPRMATLGTDMVVIGDYIYTIFGNWTKEFARYSISQNTWENLPELFDLVADGASLGTDGTNVYLLRGSSSTDFWKYDTTHGTWSSLTGPPATIGAGANLIYYNGFLYTPRGVGTTSFYRYNIGGTWATLPGSPGVFNTNHNMDLLGGTIYAAQDAGTTAFYSFDIGTTTWSTLTGSPQTTSGVGVVGVGDSNTGFVYVFRGGGSYDFWKYNPRTAQFLGLVDLPNTFSTGSDLLNAGSNIFYALRGASTSTFYKYQIGGTWSALTSTPYNLGDETKATIHGGYVYAVVGAGSTALLRYDPNTGVGGTWEQMPGAPAGLNYGASVIGVGTSYLYVTRGALTRTFYRYTIGAGQTMSDAAAVDLPDNAEASYGSRMATDGTDVFYIPGAALTGLWKYNLGTGATNWTQISTLPFAPYYGTDMTYYNGKLYFLAGNLKPDIWEYTIASSTWRRLPPVQTYGLTEIGPWAGASLESDGAGVLYTTYGNSVYRMLSYTIDASNLYVADGSWISKPIDLTYAAAWSALSLGISTPVGTGVSWYTRSSADQTSWSSWTVGSGTSIPSPVARYLQIGTSLVSGNGSSAPTIYSATVSYVGDTSTPVNPTVSGYSQTVSGVGLTSGSTYNYIAPYFSWSGATDPETGVAGYYVYYGTGSAVDPAVGGWYQTGTSYAVGGPMDLGSYYLRLKTVDGVGNTSATITAFAYVYNGLAPPLSLTQTSSVDFGLGTTANTYVIGNKIGLKSKVGFWQNERLSSFPAATYYGAMTYDSTTNKMYIIRGYGANTTYVYDLTTNTMITGATTPATFYYGDMAPGPDGTIYALRSYGTSGFWKFTVGTTVWTDLPASPVPQTVSTGGALVYDGSRYEYALRGAGDDAFYRFDTQTGGWDPMANIDFNGPINQPNNVVNDGGDLAIDVGSSMIYATQGGGRDGFAAYNINSNSWTVLPDLPVVSNYGSQLAYDPSTAAIYYLVGQNKTYFFKYDIASQLWSEMPETPVPTGYGAALTYVNGNLFLMPGNQVATFYRFNIAKNSWLVPTVGLFDGWWRGTDSRTFSYGADIVRGDGDNFYIARGNYDNFFVRYNAATGVTTRMADAPYGFWIGSELVYDSVRNRIYTAGNIYYRKMYYYDIALDTWTDETLDPPPFDSADGSSMVFNPVNGLIYWTRGATTNTFRTFNPVGVGTSKWATILGGTTPATFSYGSDMVIKNDYLYALRGANTVGAYRMGPLSVGGTWNDVRMADLPTGANIYNDGFLVDGGTNNLFACRGGNVQTCYTYDLGTTIWTLVGSTLAPYIYQGGAAATNVAGDRIYVIAGTGQLNTFTNGLYTYVIGDTNSSFEESGTYISPVHDLMAVYRFAGIDVGVSAPNNTGVVISTRTSADNVTWDSWVEASNKRTVGGTWGYQINSMARRYVQIKVALTSGDGVYTPTVFDYTINYFQDITPPDNPTTLSVYGGSDMGTTVVSGIWTNSTAPFFSWPSVGSSGAATDGVSGSGVNGYYVYFGTGATANPYVSGSYAVGTTKVGVGLTSGNTYYLRFKTKDNANNVTVDVGPTFAFVFDGIAPSNPTTITVDPPGYTATNSFNVNWSTATDDASGIESYCFKTAAVGATESCTAGVGTSGVTAYRTGTNTFYLRTKDMAGNYASDYATATFYYSSVAPSVPTNLRVTTATSNAINDFAFAWDPPTNFYGQQSGLRYYYSINELPTANSVNDIGLAVTYLSSGAYATRKGTNTLYVVAKDEAGNIDYGLYSSVDFVADTEAPGIPANIDISDVSIKETSSWRLALTWDAPSATGSGIASYKVYRSAATGADCNTSMDDFSFISSTIVGTGTSGTSYIDAGLTQTKKYYCVKACDSTNECSAVSDTVALLPDGKWRVAPTLVASPSASVKTKSAIVNWSTSRTCNSFVRYGKSSGSYGDEVGSSTQVSSHSISMTGLDPGTTYYFKASWTDEDGNTGNSDEYTLVTNPAPIVSTVRVTDVSLYSVYVKFLLSHASKATIHYGKTVVYGSTQELTTATNESNYTVKVENLEDGTKYHLKIVAQDEEGNVFSSDDYEFETLPVPKLTNMKIQQVRGMPTATLRLLWQSNTPVSSIVTYYPEGRAEMSKDQISLTLALTHQMIIKDLVDDTPYVIVIRGKDLAGNEALASTNKLRTSSDMRPPMIEDLQVEGTVSGVGEATKGQIKVEWNTDEPATSQVEYGLGTGSEYPNQTQEDGNFTLNHSVIIPDLKAAQVYHLRVVTKDKIGNLANSYDSVVVTPKATSSALDLVVGSLSKSFGFFNSLSQVAK